MTYTALTLLAIVIVVGCDLLFFRTRLVTKIDFWLAYAIMLFFQLISNAVLTGTRTVRYADDSVWGVGSEQVAPPFLGEGRIAYAPMEDIGFGFAFILLVLSVWIWLGKQGVQRVPLPGPPIWRRGSGTSPGP